MNENQVVLIVEDDDEQRELFSLLFQAWGYVVYEADNTAQACRVIDQHHRQIDIILSDLIMQGTLGGNEIRKRAAALNIRCYIISGAIDPSVDFTKPVNWEEIRHVLGAPAATCPA